MRYLSIFWNFEKQDAGFAGGEGKGRGVGDCAHSWGVDGERKMVWNASGGSEKKKYGARWKYGDRIGCALDMDRKSMTFYINNQTQGTVYVIQKFNCVSLYTRIVIIVIVIFFFELDSFFFDVFYRVTSFQTHPQITEY